MNRSNTRTVSRTRSALAAIALGLAGVVASVAVVPTTAHAGLVEPLAGTARVEAHDSFTLSVRAWGGEVTRVVLSGDGDTDLDVVVRDAYGNTVDADLDPGDDALVMWRAPVTGTYYITVRNLGGVYNRFAIASD